MTDTETDPVPDASKEEVQVMLNELNTLIEEARAATTELGLNLECPLCGKKCTKKEHSDNVAEVEKTKNLNWALDVLRKVKQK